MSSDIFALPRLSVPLGRGLLITVLGALRRPAVFLRLGRNRTVAALRRSPKGGSMGSRDAPDGTAFDVVERGGSLERGGICCERHVARREPGPVSRHQGRCAATF